MRCNKRVFLQVSSLPRSTTAHQLAELENHGIRDAVEDMVAGTLAADKAGVEEDLQVFRDVRLIPVQLIYDLVNRPCSALQCLQDTQAAGFSKDLEPAGDQLDHFPVYHYLSSIRCRNQCAVIHYIIIHAYS